MGAQGVDIQLSDHALRIFPFSLECKARATFDTLYDFMNQATMNRVKNTIPGVVLKANRKSPLILMDLEEFLDIYSQLIHEAKHNE